MMRLALSARDRRVLAIGVIVVPSALGMSRGVPLWQDWENRHRDAAAAVAERLAFARQAAHMLPGLRDSLRARRDRAAILDSVLVHGNSPAAAAATLAAIVEAIADSANVKINAMQIRADTVARGPLSRVGVRVTGVADVVGLGAFLVALDGDDRPMGVRELAVSQPEPAAPDQRVETLRIDLLIETIARVTPVKARP